MGGQELELWKVNRISRGGFDTSCLLLTFPAPLRKTLLGRAIANTPHVVPPYHRFSHSRRVTIMYAFRSRREFFSTTLLGFTCLLTLTGCTTGDSGTRPEQHLTMPASGIQGQVTRGPISPVAQQGQANTAPLPGVVVTILNTSGTEATRQTADSQGNYKIGLAAGTYQVQGLAPNGSQNFPSPPAPQTVTVTAGQFVTANLSYDMGIR